MISSSQTLSKDFFTMETRDERYTMTMIETSVFNLDYPIGLQIWLMDDLTETATHCVTVTFPEWWTQQDRIQEIERLESVYGINS